MRKSLPLFSAIATLCFTSAALAQTDASTSDAPTQAAVAAEPVIPTNAGWNQKWAFLFSLNNVLVSPNILTSPVTGSIGGAYYLSPMSAIRAGINFSRTSNPGQVTKVTTTTGENTITTYQVNVPTTTDAYNLALRGEYLRRLLKSSIAPYVGAGASIGWTWNIQKFTDDVSVVDQRTDIETNNSTFDITARAIAGAEWRIHPNFALYADYNVNLTVWSKNRANTRTTTENTVGGVSSTTENRTERDTNAFLTWNTGVSQGFTLGLAIMF